MIARENWEGGSGDDAMDTVWVENGETSACLNFGLFEIPLTCFVGYSSLFHYILASCLIASV